MRKWLTLAVVMVTITTGLAVSGADSAVGQAPKPDLIAKPGDLVRLAGTRWAFAVNEVTPRGRFSQQKVTTFTSWVTTAKGAPVPNGQVFFIWQWPSQHKSLAGTSFWDARGQKILPPKQGDVFYAGNANIPWPARYLGDPWVVTKNQRLGRKTKVFAIDQILRVPTLRGPGFDAQINCGYGMQKDTASDRQGRSALCLPVDYLSKSQERYFGFGIIVLLDSSESIAAIVYYDPTCGCGQKATP